MSDAIRVTNLSKKYKDKTAVDNISFTVGEGEMLALLGVNGAGKTTTVRMLSCLSTPNAGNAVVYGHDVVTERDEVKKLVGISTQDTAVAGKLTVEENLRFVAEIYGTADRVEEVLSAFHMQEVRKKRACTLSGGWQRKLSIAMALIGNPKIIYLDEPTLGLDVLARRELWRIIEGLKGKMTFILTTHYMEEAEALADRIAVMTDGKIIEIGTLSELEEKTGKKGLEEVFVSIVEAQGKR